MNTSKLKDYAPKARQDFINAVFATQPFQDNQDLFFCRILLTGTTTVALVLPALATLVLPARHITHGMFYTSFTCHHRFLLG